MPVFKTGAINHSAISPQLLKITTSRIVSDPSPTTADAAPSRCGLRSFLYFVGMPSPTNMAEHQSIMRDINEVLREKEAALAQVNREVEALRLVAPLLAEEPGETVAPPKMEPERAETEQKPLRKRWP